MQPLRRLGVGPPQHREVKRISPGGLAAPVGLAKSASGTAVEGSRSAAAASNAMEVIIKGVVSTRTAVEAVEAVEGMSCHHDT